MQNTEASSQYPGTGASLGQMLDLAQAYLAAAYKLMGYDTGNPIQSAPIRLVSIQAVELFLNAYLLSSGESAATIRALQHDIGKRSTLAIEAGLVLNQRTQKHLVGLSNNREYLTSRYGPEMSESWSHLKALLATVKEVSERVYPTVNAAIIRQLADRPKDHGDLALANAHEVKN